ncbi:hypothetical protein LSM04_002171 [Trypanosoma melophagium]|uniref:uncharacterized protein n=1 Tax=Trypanosoma melophagium TaxID=715481 RepID=UPI00351A16D3|nr:hypothetical protein LSM04_002171 [Trypanosoma melophagium]
MVLQDGIRPPLRLLIRHLPYDITTEALSDVVRRSCDNSVMESIKGSTASAVELSPIYLSSFSKANGNTGPNRDLEVQFQHESIEEDEDYQRFLCNDKSRDRRIGSLMQHPRKFRI